MRFKLYTGTDEPDYNLGILSDYPDLLPPDDIDVDDLKEVEDYLMSADRMEQFDALIEELRSLGVNKSEFTLGFDDSDDYGLFFKVLVRMINAEYNNEDYKPPGVDDDEPDDMQVAEESEKSETVHGEEEEEEETQIEIPKPRGIPQPNITSAEMEQLLTQKPITQRPSIQARATNVSLAPKKQESSNFDSLRRVVLREGLQMKTIEHTYLTSEGNGIAKITVFSMPNT
jgi:hypothetical protein